jgi:hypothetical protein
MNREWDGPAAHRNYPMVSVDNYLAEKSDPGAGRDPEERPRLP